MMKSESISDADLIARCLVGNADGWDALIERYQGLIYGIAIRMGLCEADAADVFQNVCLKLYQNLGSLRDVTKLAGWLGQITRQEVWLVWRKRKDVYLEDVPAFVELEDQNAISPERSLLEMEKRIMVREGLEKLSPDCRGLLALLYDSEASRSYEEISGQLGMPTGSIGPRRARCLERLRKILAEFGY